MELQPRQFPKSGEVSFHHQDTGARHILAAKNSAGEAVGTLLWGKSGDHPINKEDGVGTGEIVNIRVADAHKRQGIATHLHTLSQQFDPPARHSSNRTDDGEAWARKVGGDLPKRKGQRD
jgi:GNAT superfamily N-acetyltransferase